MHYFKRRNFHGQKLSQFRNFWPFPRKFMYVKCFSIGHLRKLMSAKFKNWPSIKVYFPDFPIFHMLKSGCNSKKENGNTKKLWKSSPFVSIDDYVMEIVESTVLSTNSGSSSLLHYISKKDWQKKYTSYINFLLLFLISVSWKLFILISVSWKLVIRCFFPQKFLPLKYQA